MYVKREASETGNHGNPHSNPFYDSVELPESLLTDYINTMGFADLTIEGGAVTEVSINQEAYDAYMATHPPAPPPEPEATVEDALNAILEGLGNEDT